MKIHSNQWLWSALAASCLATAASAQAPIFNDDFDAYGPVGGSIQLQGGWHQWGAAADPLTSLVRDNTGGGFRRSGRSVSVDHDASTAQTSDLVQQFPLADPTKKYTIRGWTYAPTGTSDAWFFIVMNRYSEPSGPFKWSVQVTMDPTVGIVSGDVGSTVGVQVPLVQDAWVELRAEVDFATDQCQVFYNGTLLDDPSVAGPGYPWTNGVFGQDIGTLVGDKTIAAIDLYHASPASAPPAIGNSPSYWDDVNVNEGFPPATYCTAKTTSQSCIPAIAASGSSSAASLSGFTLETRNVRFAKSGIYIYSNSGTMTPFQGGFLCIGGPLKRSPGLLAVGNAPEPAFPADCRGIMRMDMNAFAHNLIPNPPPSVVPSPLLLVPGTVFFTQMRGRDVQDFAGFGSLLSDALTWTVGL